MIRTIFILILANRIPKIELEIWVEIMNKSKKKESSLSESVRDSSATIAERIYETKEDMTYNESYKLERLYLHAIEIGDLELLNKLKPNLSEYNTGEIQAPDDIRKLKDSIIITITLATRAAISGGLDFEMAYKTSDYYIGVTEKLSDSAALNMLYLKIVFDFSQKVRKRKMLQTSNEICKKAIQYIYTNINQPISTSDVADHVGLSRTYFSKYFKDNLGFTVWNFILNCRLEESKHLLTNSDKSLVQISNYLCFSSQSHFQRAFKKQYGITPYKFRNGTN